MDSRTRYSFITLIKSDIEALLDMLVDDMYSIIFHNYLNRGLCTEAFYYLFNSYYEKKKYNDMINVLVQLNRYDVVIDIFIAVSNNCSETINLYKTILSNLNFIEHMDKDYIFILKTLSKNNNIIEKIDEGEIDDFLVNIIGDIVSICDSAMCRFVYLGNLVNRIYQLVKHRNIDSIYVAFNNPLFYTFENIYIINITASTLLKYVNVEILNRIKYELDWPTILVCYSIKKWRRILFNEDEFDIMIRNNLPESLYDVDCFKKKYIKKLFKNDYFKRDIIHSMNKDFNSILLMRIKRWNKDLFNIIIKSPNYTESLKKKLLTHIDGRTKYVGDYIDCIIIGLPKSLEMLYDISLTVSPINMVNFISNMLQYEQVYPIIQDIINMMPYMKLLDINMEEIDCNICYSIKSHSVKLYCNHALCSDCFDACINYSLYCPFCRSEFDILKYKGNKILTKYRVHTNP